VPGEDDLEQQIADAAQCGPAAVDVDVVEVLPAGQRTDQPAQAEDVVEVAVGQQHRVEPLEAQAAAQNLALRALAAVEQEAVVAVQNEVAGQPPRDGRRGRGRAEKYDFKHKHSEGNHRLRGFYRLKE
jgi:hypothetical protein